MAQLVRGRSSGYRVVARLVLVSIWTLSLAGCVLLFTGELGQHLELAFTIQRAVEAGAQEMVHTTAFPGQVKLKKRWFRLAGRLTPPDGEQLPDRIAVEAESSDLTTERSLQKIKLTLKIGNDGSFKGIQKFKKDLDADSMLVIVVEPQSNAVPAGTTVELCFDIVKSKKEANQLPPCVASVSFAQIQEDIFSRSCAFSACHGGSPPPAGLDLTDGNSYASLVNVPSMQQPDLDRVEPGDSEASYIIRKLRGGPNINGQPMPPPPGDRVPDALIDNLAAWIDAGAPDN